MGLFVCIWKNQGVGGESLVCNKKKRHSNRLPVGSVLIPLSCIKTLQEVLGERFCCCFFSLFFILVCNHFDVICSFDEIYFLTLPGFLCKNKHEKSGDGWLVIENKKHQNRTYTRTVSQSYELERRRHIHRNFFPFLFSVKIKEK